MQVVGTEGDLGDAVVLLCALSQLEGGPHTLLLQQSAVTKMKTPEALGVFDRVFSPLAKAQPYIKECRVENPGEQAWWNSGGFRGKGMHAKTKTLYSAVLSHLISEKGIGRGFKSDQPWLSVKPSQKTKDRVVISRSDRYRNPYMPWAKIVKFYGDRLLFVGTENEHGRFCNESGKVEHLKTSDLLDLAGAIEGSLLFIGNQSCPMAVCEGLKHSSIQETALWIPDCIYKRANAQYSYNGAVTLPGFDKDDLVIAPVGLNPDKVSTMTTPPGYWQYPACLGRPTFESAFQIVCSLPQYKSTPRDQLRRDMIQYNIDRVPDFFSPQQEFSTVKQALAQAGY